MNEGCVKTTPGYVMCEDNLKAMDMGCVKTTPGYGLCEDSLATPGRGYGLCGDTTWPWIWAV